MENNNPNVLLEHGSITVPEIHDEARYSILPHHNPAQLEASPIKIKEVDNILSLEKEGHNSNRSSVAKRFQATCEDAVDDVQQEMLPRESRTQSIVPVVETAEDLQKALIYVYPMSGTFRAVSMDLLADVCSLVFENNKQPIPEPTTGANDDCSQAGDRFIPIARKRQTVTPPNSIPDSPPTASDGHPPEKEEKPRSDRMPSPTTSHESQEHIEEMVSGKCVSLPGLHDRKYDEQSQFEYSTGDGHGPDPSIFPRARKRALICESSTDSSNTDESQDKSDENDAEIKEAAKTLLAIQDRQKIVEKVNSQNKNRDALIAASNLVKVTLDSGRKQLATSDLNSSRERTSTNSSQRQEGTHTNCENSRFNSSEVDPDETEDDERYSTHKPNSPCFAQKKQPALEVAADSTYKAPTPRKRKCSALTVTWKDEESSVDPLKTALEPGNTTSKPPKKMKTATTTGTIGATGATKIFQAIGTRRSSRITKQSLKLASAEQSQ